MSNEPQAYCACVRVASNPIQLDGTPAGRMRDRWSCLGCGASFARAPHLPTGKPPLDTFDSVTKVQIADYHCDDYGAVVSLDVRVNDGPPRRYKLAHDVCFCEGCGAAESPDVVLTLVDKGTDNARLLCTSCIMDTVA